MRRFTFLSLTLLCLTHFPGCNADTTGTQAAARSHFETEFQKWIAGDESEVTTMEYHAMLLQPPIGYDIRSITNEKPDPLAFDRNLKLPKEWKEWPAYKFNVVIEWKSESKSPIEKVTTYRLTWNSHEQKWYVAERF